MKCPSKSRLSLKSDRGYEKVDNLHIHHVGNRITSVLEDADPVTEPWSMDYAGDSPGDYMEMTYDVAGNLKTDKGRGITDIEYDLLNHPVKITFSNGNVTEYVYSADGEKLKVTHRTGVANAVSTSTTETEDMLFSGLSEAVTTDETVYRGNVLYRDNKFYMLLIPNGYVTFDNGNPSFHYYTKDYLGINRTVVNGTTGEIEQSVAYYPFGGVIADLGFGHSEQQYKFGGKELDIANGLNEYDLGARRYYQGVPTFTQLDPMAEKYYWLSPYVYCGDNPVNITDDDGQKWTIHIKKDNNGKYMINITLTGKVINQSGRNINMINLATSIESQIEEVFKATGEKFTIETNAEIHAVKSESQINKDDHIFVVLPQSEFKNNSLARAYVNGLKISLSPKLAKETILGKNKRTVAHEVVHTAGLDDNKENSKPKVKDPNYNLMTQISDLKNNTDKNKAVIIENSQWRLILHNYFNNLLNNQNHK